MIRENYRTEQRKKLLECITKNKNQYISAEQLEKELKEEGVNVGLTTIYRFLNKLEKEGKVRVELKEHTKHYQYISDECSEHYHLKCKDCGKVIHFECDEMEEFNSHISKEHKFCIDPESVIYGKCEKCNKRNKGVKK